MRDDADARATVVAAVRRLPPAALAGLREAFAAELAERLPRLRAAARDTATADDLPDTAVRDAHSLGSSAAVVGEHEACRAARAAEAALLDVLAGDAAALDRFRAGVADLDARLQGWTP